MPVMAGYDFSRLNALVVDDYRFMRNLLAAMLQQFGFREVLTADDGATAADLLVKNAIDVAFVDWYMPNVDGIAFTEGVRRGTYGRNPYLPIVMISGHTEQSRVLRAMAAGVHSYVVKPVTPKSLGTRLSQLIEMPPRFIKTDDYFGPYRRPSRAFDGDLWPGAS
jgi:CheY-like chemotaxis protein